MTVIGHLKGGDKAAAAKKKCCRRWSAKSQGSPALGRTVIGPKIHIGLNRIEGRIYGVVHHGHLNCIGVVSLKSL